MPTAYPYIKSFVEDDKVVMSAKALVHCQSQTGGPLDRRFFAYYLRGGYLSTLDRLAT